METQLVSFGNYLFEQYHVNVHSTDGKNTPLYLRQVSDADLSNWRLTQPKGERSPEDVAKSLERLYVIEGIFHGYAYNKGALEFLSMLNDGKRISFEYSAEHQGSGGKAHTDWIDRDFLERISLTDVVDIITTELDRIVPKLNGGFPYKKHTDYPSRYRIGERVKLFIMPEGLDTFTGFPATITAVHFTESKVKYDLEIKFYGDYSTRVYNVDSILVKDLDWEGEEKAKVFVESESGKITKS